MAQFTQICAMDLPYFSANCWMLPRRSLSSSIFKPGNGNGCRRNRFGQGIGEKNRGISWKAGTTCFILFPYWKWPLLDDLGVHWWIMVGNYGFTLFLILLPCLVLAATTAQGATEPRCHRCRLLPSSKSFFDVQSVKNSPKETQPNAKFRLNFPSFPAVPACHLG